ncbi:hypothetical protein [Cyanobium sp. HWJ4-Hawea]|uniref:hypothetical protein n=1 Tax=Cyanobium sp. HWJ4-Hawea TaxID=2823713 RepID=UPI0020CCAC78|nr:hypothetical protein [Cyanobium sp. HWJ4-Hawea]
MRGFRVLREHPRCYERQLFGLYVRGRREVIVCRKGNELNTLLHEGWHGVQAMCLRGEPWISSDILRSGLGWQDQRELDLLYKPSERNREAEARYMANKSINEYFKAMDQACGLSPRAATPVGPENPTAELILRQDQLPIRRGEMNGR